jgi:hypothetical protein
MGVFMIEKFKKIVLSVLFLGMGFTQIYTSQFNGYGQYDSQAYGQPFPSQTVYVQPPMMYPHPTQPTVSPTEFESLKQSVQILEKKLEKIIAVLQSRGLLVEALLADLASQASTSQSGPLLQIPKQTTRTPQGSRSSVASVTSVPEYKETPGMWE